MVFPVRARIQVLQLHKLEQRWLDADAIATERLQTVDGLQLRASEGDERVVRHLLFLVRGVASFRGA